MKVHIDLETYSSVDLRKSGLYKYANSIDFEILLLAYAVDDEEIEIIDLANGEKLPNRLIKLLKDKSVRKGAHNAAFERVCLSKIGLNIPAGEWECTQVKAAYCGLPLSLDDVSKVLGLTLKDAAGKNLIRYFSMPVKPTITNGKRVRNFPWHSPEKWEAYKSYCKTDVKVEREISFFLSKVNLPAFERLNYIIDQQINDKGILADIDFSNKAFEINQRATENNISALKNITKLANPNSAAQLAKWLSDALQEEIKSTAKDKMADIIKLAEASTFGNSKDILAALDLRSIVAKTAIKKYTAIKNCVDNENRVRGLFQFYGANRTGRWAGRLVQMQNLARNYLKNLDQVRSDFKNLDYESLSLIYPDTDIPGILGQLVRTAFIAPAGQTLIVSDFSAIEARVIAWLADEKWRLEVFASHGKIYEASAAMMFSIPIESVTEGSELRQKGKIAELALGYGGSLGALKKMGGEGMGLSDDEMTSIVKKWRKANVKIVELWRVVEQAAVAAVANKSEIKLSAFKGLIFKCDGSNLTIELPSGRSLFYYQAKLKPGAYNKMTLIYKGVENNIWCTIDTYGGKLVENIIQAIARDCLAYSMQLINKELPNKLVMHVHDEVVLEELDAFLNETQEKVVEIMSLEIPWAPGLKLTAKAFNSKYYKKD
jgi:DNA polymerase bacteriophage-type